jgi:HK97 family phage major capsid protein
MSLHEITERVSQLGSAWEQFKQVNDARLREVEKKGHADPLYYEHLDKISQSMDNTKQRVERLEAVHSRPDLEAKSTVYAVPSAYQKAFVNYLRKGQEGGLEALQQKSLSVGTDADGGYLVTNEMGLGIAKIIRAASPLRELARVETISTDTLDVIEDAGLAAASWTTETGAVSETSSPQIGKHSVTTHEMYAQPKATQKLLDDAAIDVEGWIAEKVGEKFAAMEATAFISGSGSGQPKGILSYTAGTSWGQVEQVNSGVSASLTGDSIINLYYSLKEVYARNASFLMNRSVVQLVRMLKESTTGQYLWQPGLVTGTPDTLLGVPVYQAADMPVAAANALAVAVADFRQAYLIVDRVGLRILRDPFTDKPFVKFYTTRRVGGEVVNYEAIKLLKLAV